MIGLENKYAVVGLGGIFPGASNVGEFWDNIVNKRVSIQRLPQNCLEREVFFRPEQRGKADKQDCSYTDLLATIPGLNFDPQRYRLPPTVAKHMDDNQKVALLCTSEALDAGALKSVSKDRVCVFMGTTMIGTSFTDHMRRFAHRELLHTVQRREPQCYLPVSELSAELLAGTCAVTEDTAPGLLQNIYAARIASVFDLHGHAFTLDAACASGLATIICGIQQLRSGEADAVICGAVDMANAAEGRIIFSGIGALSPDGSFPFDARANGFVIGQGGGVVVLKRLKDALSAGDAIHAVVTGYGQSSDGKGKAIAAPNEQWQAESIRRACVMAQVPVESIEMIEAHGTSTQVGDASEVAAMKRCFAELGATSRGYCGVTSVKSNIGHLKGAAGIAGFIKAVLALRHAMLPPTASFESENPKLALAGSPFYVLKDAREWPARVHPRRTGVNAFGFGGANYHVLLEEYRPEDYAEPSFGTGRGCTDRSCPDRASVERESSDPADASRGSSNLPEAGSDRVVGDAREAQRETESSNARASNLHTSFDSSSPEIAVFSADTPESLLEQVDGLAAQLRNSSVGWAQALFAHNARVRVHARCRLAMTVRNPEELVTKAALVRATGPDATALTGLTPKGIQFGSATPISSDQVVLMFPGQGSQYPDMSLPLAVHFAAAERTLARADAIWEALKGATISSLLHTEARGVQATECLLRDTRNTHPTMMLASLAAYRVLHEAGLRAGAMIGHSLGEYSALVAAGVLSFADGFQLMRERGEAFCLLEGERAGAMLALPLNETQALQLLDQTKVNLALANLNARQQTIVSGSEAEVTRLLTHCAARQIDAKRLNVSHAFHSPLMRPAEEHFRTALRQVTLSKPNVRVIANSDNEYYGEDLESIRGRLETQISAAVRFTASIERLHADGYRTFVEVGPSSVLSSCTKDILAGRPATVLCSDSRKGDSLEAFCRLLCGLFALGLPVDPCACSRLPRTPATGASAIPTGAVQLANDTVSTRSAQVPPHTEPRRVPQTSCVVYSGVSVGLPGSFKDGFRDDNFDQLFEGHNLIERLSDDERQRLVDLRITKLIKSEQGASYATLEALDQVIQLAGKMGRLNLPRDYHIDEKDAANMSSAIAHAVAAGYEALRDAHIPLVHEYAQTATGSVLPDRWALPSEMQTDTGVIFANGFPMVDPIIAEVSRHLSYRLGNRIKQELLEFYDTLLQKVTHRESRKILTDWFALNYARLCGTPSQSEVYSFNHQLMTQIAMQANNRLAKAIAARGPNFQLNAACSSTATAVTLAEELIRAGRARRIIVIGADDPSSEFSLPYLGGGFLSTGACTNESDLYAAALPFDKRRNGMIMGSGAVGLVVEAGADCAERGVAPVCELLGTHCFNTASHGSQLDVPRYAEELERFVSRLECDRGLSRDELAKRLVYVSHETYTPARGGCSEAEAVALRHVFGEHFGEIEISNTKGMTGHTMGASIEDAAAAKALQYGRIPPVVNHRVPDPALEGLKLSKGGERQVEYALRMAAGFGSQGNFSMLAKVAHGDERIVDRARYSTWLNRISGLDDAELTQRGRQLVVRDTRPGAVLSSRPSVSPTRPPQGPSGLKAPKLPSFAAPSEAVANSALPPNGEAPRLSNSAMPVGSAAAPRQELTRPAATEQPSLLRIQQLVLEILSEVTGYAPSMLDLDMELEADLGIDTVKQATVLSRLAERIGLTEGADLRISEYQTIRKIVELSAARAPERAAPATPSAEYATLEPLATRNESAARVAQVAAVVRGTIAEVTGYSLELLSADLELEADLGVDTVKQATILGILSERFAVAGSSDLKMSELSTIADLIALFSRADAPQPATDVRTDVLQPAAAVRAGAPQPAVALSHERTERLPAAPELPPRPDAGLPPADSSRVSAGPTSVPVSEPQTAAGAIASSSDEAEVPGDTLSRLYAVIAAHSPYPAEMLESDLTLNSDMGLTAEALDQIRRHLIASFELPADYQLPADAPLERVAESLSLARCRRGLTLANAAPLARQVLQRRSAPLAPTSSEIAGKSVWLVGDESSSVQLLQAKLQELGANVRSLIMPASGALEELDSALDHLLVDGARSDVVIDATHSPVRTTGNGPGSGPDLSALARVADCRFLLWKRLQASARLPTRVLAITCIDGCCGTDASEARTAQPLYGFCQGFYRTLGKELGACRVSLLDTHSSDWRSEAPEVVKLVVDELTTESEGIDVCYAQGQRYRLALVDVPRQAIGADVRLPNDEVILVTGGGAGITSALIVGLAQLQPVSVALIGRTALDDTALRFHALSPQEKLAEKQRLEKQLGLNHARVTPVMVERAYAELQRAHEILCTLEALRAAGCRAEYHAADVTDLERMREVVGSVRRTLGPITTLVHGAGLERSHGLAQKSSDEFRRVHSVKTLGAYHLSLLCSNEPLRRVVAMSSISGVLGSKGQLDYSGANAFLDQWVNSLGTEGKTRGLSLVWSGWAERGIASRSEFLQRHADALGLHLIDPEAGVSAALRELLAPRLAHVVLHRGISGLLPAALSSSAPRVTPMIDWIELRNDQERVIHRSFSTVRDVLLDQHRFAGTPLMPGVAFMEWMAEAHAVLEPERSGAHVFRQLQFLDAFKLYRGEARDTQLLILGPNGSSTYEMSVLAPLAGRLANTHDLKTYCRAFVSTEMIQGLEARSSGWELGELRPASFREELSHATEFKQNVILGPLLNDAHHPDFVATAPDVEWGPGGIVTRVALPRAQTEESRYPLAHYLINPGFLDAMHQAGAVLAIKLTGQIFLPIGAREFVVLKGPSACGNYRVNARLKRAGADEFLYDIALWHGEHSLCAVAWDVCFRRITQ